MPVVQFLALASPGLLQTIHAWDTIYLHRQSPHIASLSNCTAQPKLKLGLTLPTSPTHPISAKAHISWGLKWLCTPRSCLSKFRSCFELQICLCCRHKFHLWEYLGADPPIQTAENPGRDTAYGPETGLGQRNTRFALSVVSQVILTVNPPAEPGQPTSQPELGNLPPHRSWHPAYSRHKHPPPTIQHTPTTETHQRSHTPNLLLFFIHMYFCFFCKIKLNPVSSWCPIYLYIESNPYCIHHDVIF